jgi:hypothetical protein
MGVIFFLNHIGLFVLLCRLGATLEIIYKAMFFIFNEMPLLSIQIILIYVVKILLNTETEHLLFIF